MKLENKNAIFNILGPICLNGISFFSMPIFTRLLGPEQYGILSVYNTWVGIFAIIFGLQVQGSIGTAVARLEKSEIKEYVSSILVLGLGFALFCLSLGYAFSGWIADRLLLSPTALHLMGIQSVGAFVIAFSSIAFVFYKKAKSSFFVNVTTALSTTTLSLILILFYFPPDRLYLGKMYGMAVPISIMAVGLSVYFIKAGHCHVRLKYIRFCLPICLPLIFHGLSQILLGQSDRVMLQRMIGNGPTGIYSFMIVFSGVLNAIWNALNNTWVPFYYDDLKAGLVEKIAARTKNYIFIFSIMVIVFTLWAPEVIKIFAPSTFWGAIDLLPLFVLSNYFIFLYSFPVNFEFFHKTTYTIAIGTVCAAGMNIALNYWMIPLWGVWGAAASTLLAHVLLFAFHEFLAAKVLRFTYHYTTMTFLPAIVVVTAAVSGAALLRDFAVLRWGIGCVLSGVFFYSIYRRKSLF